jgi:hypothetical protein
MPNSRSVIGQRRLRHVHRARRHHRFVALRLLNPRAAEIRAVEFAHHAISTTLQTPELVDVLLNPTKPPDVTVKYSGAPLATIFIEDDVTVADTPLPSN